MKIAKALLVATCGVGQLLADGLVGVGVDSFATLPAGDLGATNYVVEGQLRKTSSGEQQLESSRLAGEGEILVSQGTLRIVSEGTVPESSWKPLDVLAKAATWIDVSESETVQLVEGSDANVWQILDVRETDRTQRTAAGAYAYPHWMAHTNIAHSAAVRELGPDHWFPTYSTAANGAPAYVDFGGYQSGQSLKMYADNGKASHLTNVRHIFVVAGIFDYKWGFLLDGGSSTYTAYVPQNYSRADFSISAYYSWLNNGDKQQLFRTGRFRVDGAIIDPFTTSITEGYHLLDMPILEGNRLSGFFNGSEIASDANQYRQGGGRLCEVIAFTVPISEAERTLVANYLMRKWFNVRKGSIVFKVAAGAAVEAVCDVMAGQEKPLYAMGGVTLVKEGAGTLVGSPLTGGEDQMPLTVDLKAGTVDTAQTLVLEQGSARTYDVSDGVVSAQTVGSDTLIKTGDGDLRLKALDPAVKKIQIDGGTLCLVCGEDTSVGVPSGALSGIIEDPSFEGFSAYNIEDNPTSGEKLSSSAAKQGWMATDEKVGSDQPHVVKWAYKEGNNAYYCRNDIPYPDGLYALVLAYSGAQTKVVLPRAGVYQLSFAAAPRPNYAGGEFRVSIDETVLSQVMTYNDNNTYVRHVLRTPFLPAGEHTLVFQADRFNNKGERGETILTGNKVCMLDDIHLDWLSDDDPGGWVANGNFEINPFQYKMPVSTNAVSDWAVGGADANNRVRLICDGSAVAAARYVAVDGTATLTGKVRFQTTGTYELHFKMRQPVAAATAFKSLDVRLGENGTVFSGTVVNAAFGTWEDVSAGPFTIAEGMVGADLPLVIAGTVAGASVSIDDVRVEPAKVSAFRLTDTFSSAAAWTVDVSDPGLTGVPDSTPRVEFQTVGSPTYAAACDWTWGAVSYDDNRRVGIRNRGTIYRTIDFPAAGTYRVSVVSMGRFWRYEDQHLENPSILRAYGGQSFSVWVGSSDGAVTNQIGVFAVDGVERWTRHTFYATLDVAGTYRLGFSGLKTSDTAYDGVKMNSHGGMLDGLVVEPVVVRSAAPLEKTLEIAVSEGACLSLETGTTNEVAEVRYGGRSHSGFISAETCPDFVSGTGVLFVSPKGTLILFR
ncbi:MAG: hypothetical protein Q4G65_15885 [bacterium]|nr:hypothetical protein [bacterium]